MGRILLQLFSKNYQELLRNAFTLFDSEINQINMYLYINLFYILFERK